MTDHHLRHWNNDWVITVGTIKCSECMAGQVIEQKHYEFVHAPYCSRHGPGQRPYWDLKLLVETSQSRSSPPD